MKKSNSTTKEQILSVSEALFSEYGYAGTSISNIVQNIGIQKSSLYAHFANKDELFVKVFQNIIDRASVNLSEIFLNPDLDEKEKLHQIFLLFCVGSDANLFRMGLFPNPECKEELRKIIANFEDFFSSMLSTLLKQLRKKKPITDKSDACYFEIFCCFINGAMSNIPRFDAEEYREKADLVWQTFCEWANIE